MSLKKITATAILAATLMPVAASAQTYNTIVEPVPAPEDLSNIVRARHIRPGDVSPEEYAKLLEEAEKVRSYQGTSSTYVDNSVSTYTTTTVDSYASDVTSVSSDSAGYTIELFDTPATETVTYASTPTVTTYSSTVTVPSGNTGSYTVVSGDTLYSISRRYNVALSELKSANGLSGNNIRPGQSLSIPTATRTVISENTYSAQPTLVRNVQPLPTGNIYAVLPGDTLYSISRRACSSVSEVATINGISPRGVLRPGQRLTMPANHCLR